MYTGRQMLGGVVAVSVIVMSACSPPPAPTADGVRPVKTTVVAAGNEPRVRSFPGRVEATRAAELAFQVSGLIVSLPVKEGQALKAGDVIGQLRPDEFQARLDALKGQLDQSRAALRALQAGERPEERLRREAVVRAAEARLANARSEMDRNVQLRQARAVSQADFERAETEYRVAEEEYQASLTMSQAAGIAREEEIEAQEGLVRGLEARVVEASLQLSDATLKAPFDGVVAKRFVEENQNVTAKQPVVAFQDAQEIDIAVDVPESVMASEIDLAEITSMTAAISGAPGIEFPVHIREVAKIADPVTRTFRVRVAMKAPDGVRVLPGMTARVTVSYHRSQALGSRIMIPTTAVASTPEGKSIVWVINSENVVNPKQVQVGVTAGDSIEVTEGLQPGERIAIAGVRFLREGMKVRELGDALGARS